MSELSTAVVWLRRDLRLHDHPALTSALADHDRVVPLFVLDDGLLGGRFASGPRAAFMLGCLEELAAALRERGSGLVVRRGDPREEVPRLAREAGAATVLWTAEPGPYAQRRDSAVAAALAEVGIATAPQPGSYCADDPGAPRTGAGAPFTVFSPFWRAQAKLPRRDVHPAPRALPALPRDLPRGQVPRVEDLGLRDDLSTPVREPGETAGRHAMHGWLRGGIHRYHEQHDALAGGTSELSPYLRWGCISPRELEAKAAEHDDEGPRAFVRQLAWRDFYAHVLLHHPGNLRHEHQAALRGTLEWDDDTDLLDAWAAGMTGYPLVDAAMRQLRATGWMHNRARLVVGSFLTKDLHLDWRLGEAHFERWLLDGEPAQNNGNWQWIASTGVDPAPAFRRVFNPVLQQQKFDPDGTYVRRWVPELANVPDDVLAEPWRLRAAEREGYGAGDYPEPIVDHAAERRRALERYRTARA